MTFYELEESSDDTDQHHAKRRQKRTVQETAQIISFPGPSRMGRSTFTEDLINLGEHANTTPDTHESFLDTFEIADFEDLPEILDAPQTDLRIQEESKKKEKTRERVSWT